MKIPSCKCVIMQNIYNSLLSRVLEANLNYFVTCGEFKDPAQCTHTLISTYFI